MNGLLPILALLLAAPPSGEVRIPDRPEQLRFEGRRFEVPKGEAYLHRLSNGVPVYVVEDRSLPLVDVALAVRAGDYLDPAERAGLASLTGALVRRGGTLTRSADEFDLRADFLGAEIDSVGGSTRSGATLSCGSRVFGEALDLFFEMVKNPRFDAARLAVARGNLRESLARRNDDALEVLDREWGWLLFGPRHFTTRKVTPSAVDAITREELIGFHQRTWLPRGMVLAVSGDVETRDVLARLERQFAGWTPQGPHPPDVPWPPPAPDHVPKPGLYHAEHAAPQTKIALGHLGAERRSWDDPDAVALLVMNEVLGGGGTVSRLRARLRAELGLVYRAQAYFGIGQYGPSDFQVFLETDAANAGRVIDTALAEVRRLRQEAVPEVELAFAKRTLTDAFPLLFDTPGEVAGRFAEDLYLGRPHEYWRTYRDRVAAVTAADVRRVAQKYLQPDRMVILTVGRWSDIARGAGAAGVNLERLAGAPVTRLPARDPLTLESPAR